MRLIGSWSRGRDRVAVELDQVGRERARAAQRAARAAGVVERDRRAGGAQRGDGGGHRLGGNGRAVLGELDDHAAQRAGLGDQAADLAVEQGRRAQVDRQRLASRHPRPRAQRGFEHARLERQRERRRQRGVAADAQVPEGRAGQAAQCLLGNHAAVGEVHDGLQQDGRVCHRSPCRVPVRHASLTEARACLRAVTAG
jgi:hypothetical protein